MIFQYFTIQINNLLYFSAFHFFRRPHSKIEMEIYVLQLQELENQWLAEELGRDIQVVLHKFSTRAIQNCLRTNSPVVRQLRKLITLLCLDLLVKSNCPGSIDFPLISYCSLEELTRMIRADFWLQQPPPHLCEEHRSLLVLAKKMIENLLVKMQLSCPCQFCSPLVCLSNSLQ